MATVEMRRPRAGVGRSSRDLGTLFLRGTEDDDGIFSFFSPGLARELDWAVRSARYPLATGPGCGQYLFRKSVPKYMTLKDSKKKISLLRDITYGAK